MENKIVTKKFDADVGKILDLMINSIYSNKEIFLREIISNGADACGKLKYLSQTNDDLLKEKHDFHIKVSIDKTLNIITIFDNGIGMDKNDLVENLGKIAHSGTGKFIESIKQNDKVDNNLIGQFGVGFYSAFMVSSKVEVITKKISCDQAYSWSSSGNGEYHLSEIDVDFNHGTKVIMHIKDSDKEFIDQYRIKTIIKNYSDHIDIPIFYIEENKEEVQLNSASALWRANKSNVTEEQYKTFYNSVSHSTDEPYITIHNKNEGLIEFINLLFIPSEKTFDLFHPDRASKIKLYIKKIFITDTNIDLVPKYLRFVKGIVDSDDLPLNISRETLQNNPLIATIKKSITKRIFDELKKKCDSDRKSYNKFWNNFGSVIKEGLCEGGPETDKIMDLSLFKSTKFDELITLDEYIKDMLPEQKSIYYISGEKVDYLKNSPQIEGLVNKGINVLLLTDNVDDFWVTVQKEYKNYNIISATRSDIDILGDESKKNNDENNHKDLIKYFKSILEDKVKDIKISKKLTNSPVCLVVDEKSMDIRMERFLVEQNQLNKLSAKILEINPSHIFIKTIESNLSNPDKEELNKKLVNILMDIACISEGEPLHNKHQFISILIELLSNTVDNKELSSNRDS